MNVKEQIEKLRDLKEQFIKKQALLNKAKKLREQVSPTNIARLLENDLEQAKLILAAKDVCDKLQKIAEHLAELGAEEIMPLADAMKGAFGPELAASFEHAANENIQKSLETVRAAKDSINDAILKVEGKLSPSNDMNDSPETDLTGPNDMSATPATPSDNSGNVTPAASSDPFGGAESSSGPDDEPLGRAKKESKQYSGKVIAEADYDSSWATFSDLYKDKHGIRPKKEKFSPEKVKSIMDKWSDKKDIEEGKSFRYDDEDDNENDSKNKFVKRRQSSQEKRSRQDNVEEGKSFRHNDDEDDNDVKKKIKNKNDASKFKKNQQDATLNASESYSLTFLGKKILEKHDLSVLLDWALAEANQKLSKQKFAEFRRNALSKALTQPEVMAGWIGKKVFTESEINQIVKTKGRLTAEKIAEGMADAIALNIRIFGRGKAAQVVEQFTSSNAILEGEEISIIEVFESMYGVSPAEYSISITKRLKEDDTDPLSTTQLIGLGGAVTQIASKMASDPTLANQPATSVMNDVDPVSRTALQKVAGDAGNTGQTPNVGQVIKAAGSEIEKNKASLGMSEDKVEENINAAHWPVNSKGQYKGEPMSTDYGKHSVKMTANKSPEENVGKKTETPMVAKKDPPNTVDSKETGTPTEIEEKSVKKKTTKQQKIQSPGPYKQPGSKKEKASDMEKVVD